MRAPADDVPVAMRRGPGSLYRRLRSVPYLLTRDRDEILRFLSADLPIPLSRLDRLRLVRRFYSITHQVRAYHTQAEMLRVALEILRRADRRPTVLEAGAGKGSSTAKLSLATRIADGKLFVFDSFKGLPANQEVHQNLDGRPVVFHEGAFLGRLGGVERVLETWGAPEVCELRKGWFEQTLPGFQPMLDVVLLDVDLLASTRTCLIHLFPRLRRDGVLFSQDGHLKAIVSLLGSTSFWRDEVGVEPPEIRGLGQDKLLEIRPKAGSAVDPAEPSTHKGPGER